MSKAADFPGRRGGGGLAAPLAVFGLVFAVTIYALTPDAPGRQVIAARVAALNAPSPSGATEAWNQSKPGAVVNSFTQPVQPDQNFSGCDAARAAGRQNIPSSDPSYRLFMDGDRDGFACEPYSGAGVIARGPGYEGRHDRAASRYSGKVRVYNGDRRRGRRR